MKFIVNTDHHKVKGSVVGEHVYMHVRTCPSFEDFDKTQGFREGPWLSKGANHKLIPAGHNYSSSSKTWVYREEPRNAETVDVASLDDLVSLADHYGDVM